MTSLIAPITRGTGVLALVLSLVGVLAAPTPVAAYQVVSETGLLGPYTFSESVASPRARCGYGARIGDKHDLRWMRLGPPTVKASDRDSDKRDSRIAGWRFLIQRSTDLTTWTTVARSPIQKARAYEDKAAAFSAMKVYYRATNPLKQFRALVVVYWYRADGTIEGRAKLTPQYYQLRFPDRVEPTTFDACIGAWQYI